MSDEFGQSLTWELYKEQLTTRRRERLEKAATQRTDRIALVVQDVHQPHNVSACLRSAEAFGIQNVHVVTLKENFRVSTVARGVDQWLHIKQHQSIAACVQELRTQGYKLALAFPHQEALSVQKLPLEQPLAVIFGNEHDGLAQEWQNHGDVKFTIPMVGLVESLNISVSVAITLFHLRMRCEAEWQGYQYDSPKQQELLDRWAEKLGPGEGKRV